MQQLSAWQSECQALERQGAYVASGAHEVAEVLDMAAKRVKQTEQRTEGQRQYEAVVKEMRAEQRTRGITDWLQSRSHRK